MKLHAEPKPLTEPLAGGREGATVVVEPLLGGEVRVAARVLRARRAAVCETLKLLGVGTPRSQVVDACPAPRS